MENVFDTLCSALGEPENKKLFLDSEGVDLMVLMMKYVASHSEGNATQMLTLTQGQDASSFAVYQGAGLRDVGTCGYGVL